MYEPQVDDYVIWKRPSGDIDEGWVYFKGEPVDNEKRLKEAQAGWANKSQADIDALPSTDQLPPKYFARNENRVNLPATEMNQVLAAISKQYRNRRDFDTF